MVTDRLIKIARSQGRLLKTGEPVKPLTSHEDPDIYIYIPCLCEVQLVCSVIPTSQVFKFCDLKKKSLF